MSKQTTHNDVTVYIRHWSESEGVTLGTIPLTQVGEVLPLLSAWGLYFRDDGETHPPLSGQFARCGNAVVFEVIVYEDD